MDNFLRYFYQDIGRVFRAFFEIVGAFFNVLNDLLNFPMRMEIIKAYESEFGTMDWIMLFLANLLLVILCVLIIFFLVKFLRKALRFRVNVKEYDAMAKQVRSLQRDLLRANYEKDKLLAMKVAELGGDGSHLQPLDIEEEQLEEDEYLEEENEEETTEEEKQEFVPNSNRNTFQSPCVDPSESRFFRLTSTDNYYKTEYVAPEYDNDITLEGLCVSTTPT